MILLVCAVKIGVRDPNWGGPTRPGQPCYTREAHFDWSSE